MKTFLSKISIALVLLNVLTAQAASIEAVVSDNEHNPIADAVVMAVPDKFQASKKPAKMEVIDQVDKEFLSHVTAVPLGTAVNFPNKDNIRHHVYSFSPAKSFELPLYTGNPAKPVVFDKPGVVKLGCNIHDWMVAYIYVTDAPYFTTSNSEGKIHFPNLPADTYTLRLWHPRMLETEESTQKSIKVGGVGEVHTSWQMSLKPDYRARRAPMLMQQGY